MYLIKTNKNAHHQHMQARDVEKIQSGQDVFRRDNLLSASTRGREGEREGGFNLLGMPSL